MRRRIRMRWMAGAALVASLCGCHLPPAVRAGPPPTASELLAHLARRNQQITALRTEAKVDYFSERGERIKVTMTFLVARRSEGQVQLRADAESPLGGTVASFAADRGSVQLLDVRANRFFIGDATPCSIGRLMGVQLHPQEIADVIAGTAPLQGEARAITWDPEGSGHEVLTIVGSNGERKIKLTPNRWDLASVELRDPKGRLLYRVEHDNYGEESGLRFPGRTHLVDVAHRADAKIRYRSRDVNPELPAQLFFLQPPAGIERVQISCDDGARR